MTTEVIEGTAVDITPEPRELVVVEPRTSVRLAGQQTPEDMIQLATRMATALKDIVDRQRLYATIQGKKYPQVEAWMTIGRMDNVVAREAEPPIRHDDGSYEAFVELIRLGDSAVIGRASALCGTQDDKPWNGRSEPARRSMAVTRATSRAFRQQYSWIMALAGYEPTPVEEMPPSDAPEAQARPDPENAGLMGVAKASGKDDFELRQEARLGHVLPFRLTEGRKSWKAVAHGPLAELIAEHRQGIEGQTVTCWGHLEDRSFPKGEETIRYQVLVVDRLKAGELDLPGPADDPDEFTEAELDQLMPVTAA